MGLLNKVRRVARLIASFRENGWRQAQDSASARASRCFFFSTAATMMMWGAALAGEPPLRSPVIPLGASSPRPTVIPGLSGMPGPAAVTVSGRPAAPTRPSAEDAAQTETRTGISTLALVRVNYMAIEQPLSAALVELAALAGLSLVVEGRIDSVLVQASLIGPLQDVLDDLSRRHGFEWSLTSGTIEIIPSDGVVSRSIKTTGLNEERIASLLAAAGIEDARGRITFDPATQVLRIRGAPRFVARAEAAILVVAEKEDNINVVRFGRTSRVVGP
jgi:hypothetical protein